MPMENIMSNYNFERMIDKIDNIINYEIQEQIEYMVQDAFGVASFDELDRVQIQELKLNIQELDYESLTLNAIRYNVDRWDEENELSE